MRFVETEIPGVLIVEPEEHRDERGFFARTWCRNEFDSRGLATDFVQENTTFNRLKGTLRGLHHQVAPHEEAKLVRCTRGAIYDVAVDLRPGSATRGAWVAAELTADNRRMLYVPEGCAHGYQTLADDTDVCYLVSAFYAPDAERGVRYDDPAISIHWPLPPSVMSPKDLQWQPIASHAN